MDELSGQPSGAARRRRERRLRSMLRHEQQTVRMALAAALHHSAGPKEKKVELQQYAALRGQNTGARAREEVVQVAHVALRRQKTPPPGVRPGSLVDPGPQRSDRTVRRSSGKDPLLVVASLADASADGVDAATLSFLTASTLEARRKEEEEEERLWRPQCVAAALHEGQGRAQHLGEPWHPPHSCPAAQDGGACGEARCHQCLQARALLSFFFIPEEEEKEEEAVMRTG